MATIRAYTTVEQSRKLAEILPLESADMNYWCGTQIRIGGYKTMDKDLDIPCWSLTALLNIIPTIIGSIFEEDSLRLRIDKSETDFNIWYDNLDTGMVEEGIDIIETNPVDACYEMIIRLHELNLL